MEWVRELTSRNVLRSRRLLFDKTKNFRDLGGYKTQDGRSVRWGVLFRSDALSDLTNRDIIRLAGYDLKCVIDFRSEREVSHEPDRLPERMRLVNLPMEDASTRIWHEAKDEMVKNMRTLDPAYFMKKTNVELATKFTPMYRQFYQELLAANGLPILFHCVAGKDRTGFAAATLLRILGVPMDVVLQDYLLTNRYLLGGHAKTLFMALLFKGWRFFKGLYGFMKADVVYLSAAFAALEEQHGSFEAYVRGGLGLSEHDLERLRNAYLE